MNNAVALITLVCSIATATFTVNKTDPQETHLYYVNITNNEESKSSETKSKKKKRKPLMTTSI